MNNSISFSQALSKTMALCSKAEKCIYDIQQKLYEWGINSSESEKIIKRLVNEKYIDEERYARFFVRDKFHFNKWGKVKIRYMLKEKKIPSDIIKNALQEIEDSEYMQALIILLNGKGNEIKFSNEYDRRTKLFRFAQSRGFEIEFIEKALSTSHYNSF